MHHTWMRYLSPLRPPPARPGLPGVGLQHGELPTVGPRTLDHHVAVVVSAGGGWFRRPRRTPPHRRRPAVAHARRTSTTTDPTPAGMSASSTWPGGPPPRTPNSATSNPTAPSCRSPTPPAPVPPSAASPAPPTAATPSWRIETGAAVHGRPRRPAPRRADLADGDPVLHALARDAFQPLSVAEHAARHGMTPAELASSPSAAGGAGRSRRLPPRGVRLGHAKELLAATELPVAAVARRVGYDDPAYFSRLFTRRVGMAPSASANSRAALSPAAGATACPTPTIRHDRAPARHVKLLLMTTSYTGNRTTGRAARSTPPCVRNSPGCATASTTSTPPSSTCSPNASECTQQVGHLKAARQLPPADPSREAHQIARLRRLAESAKLDPAFAEKLLNFIIAEVIRHHESIADGAGRGAAATGE